MSGAAPPEDDRDRRVDAVFERRSSPFRRRLTLSAIVVIALLAGLGALAARHQYQAGKTSAEQELHSRVVLAATVFDTFFEGRVQTLQTIAAAPAFTSLDLPAMRAYVRRVEQGTSPAFTQGIGWIDLAGRARVSSVATVRVVDVSDRGYFKAVKASGAPFVSEGLRSRANGNHAIYVAVPTRDADGKLTGVLAGGIKLEPSKTSTRTTDLGYTGLVVLDRAGRELTLTSYARPSNRRLVQQLRTGDGVLDGTAGLSGDGSRVVAYASAKVPGWTVVLDRSHSEVFAAARRSFVVELVSIIVAALVVLGIVGWALVRSHRAIVEEREQGRHWHDLVQTLGEASAADEVAAALGAAVRRAISRATVIVALEEDDGRGLRTWAFAPGDDPVLERRQPGVGHVARLAFQSRLPLRLTRGPALDAVLDPIAEVLPEKPGELYAVPMQTHAGPAQAGTTTGSLTVLLPASEPLDADEEALLAAHADQAARALRRARLSEREHTVALALQRSLLPAQLPPIEGISLAGRYNAGTVGLEVGGDWYGAIRRPDGIVHLTVGDVAGRGVAAAALMGQLRFAFRALAYDYTSPAEVARRIARLVPESGMATATFLTLDPYTGELSYTSAGHPPSILLDALSGDVTLLDGAASPPLGWAAPSAITEANVTLRARMTLLAYTDGLVERRGESIDDGIDRVADMLRLRPELGADDAADALLDAIVTPLSASDDIALLLVQMQDVPAEMRIEIPADPTELRRLRARLNAWLTRRGIGGEHRMDTVLAVSEACNNAIEHAYEDDRGTIRLELEHHGRRLRIVVEDDGTWKDTPSDPMRGRGLLIMRETMDSTSVGRSERGTRIELELDTAGATVVDLDGGAGRRQS